MAQAVLATAADGRPDCPPHQADCLSPPQLEKRERLHAAVAGHGSVPVAMPRTLPLQAHSPDEGGNQPDEGGNRLQAHSPDEGGNQPDEGGNRLQAHSPEEGGTQPDEGGHQGGHRHALGAVALPH